jgi:hypothetical protein
LFREFQSLETGMVFRLDSRLPPLFLGLARGVV